MRVIVVCETSGTVRDAFRARGHDATSLDVLPTEKKGPHIQVNLHAIDDSLFADYDMAICHPPCTYFSYAGNGWDKRDENRAKLRAISFDFFRRCYRLPTRYVAVENPYPSKLKTLFAPPTQVIQPWMFGEPFTKSTGLWLRNLSGLVPTHHKPQKTSSYVGDTKPIGPYREQWKWRSKTFQGIADAMADQWGKLS